MPAKRDGEERARVLLVMGEILANLVALTLRHGRYETRATTATREARELVRTWDPQLAIIDVDHHFEFVDLLGRGIAHGEIPLLALTRKRDTAVKLSAFERGVDDIIEVPFTLDEIIARPFALMRRAHGIEVDLIPRINLGGLIVDVARQRAELDGKKLELSPIQQSLLYVLAANAGKTLSRNELVANIWGEDFGIESNVVDRHVRELRVKLGDDWRAPKYIETVARQGYRFRALPESRSN